MEQSQFQEKQIDIHIAEYNAMNARHTTYLNMQVLMITAGIAWALMIASLRNSLDESILLWALLIGWQLISLVFIYCFYVSYRIVDNIENILKPKVACIINSNNIWEVNKYYYLKTGKLRYLLDMVCFLYITIWFIGIIIHRIPTWNYLDWRGLIINISAYILVIAFTLQIMKIKIRGWKFD